MSEHTHPTFLEAVRREWWIPVAITVLAGGIALALSSASPAALYEGRAIVIIDAPTVAKFPDLPKPDDMIRELASNAFSSEVASRAVVPSDTVAAGLKSSTRADPQSQLIITFRSTDKALASRVATTAAGYAAERVSVIGGKEIWDLQRRVTETQRAMKEVLRIQSEAGRNASSSFELLAAGTEWEMRMRLYEDTLALRTLRNAYYYNGNLTTSDVSPVHRRGATIAGALIFGFVLGLVIAVFREAILSRPMKDAS
ncbi:MAG: hypothetical protein LLG08_02855 [Actinomycetia bacterium]|nr:hypothetical protein [Actinomycetes bacterium]